MQRGCNILRWALPAAVFIWAAAPAAAQVTVTPAARGYDIDVDSQASAAELIDAIAAATGAAVKGQPEDATINPNHLRGTSLERALRLLLPGAAFTVRFGADDRPTAIVFLSPQGAESSSQDGGDGQPPALDDMPPDDGSSPDRTAPEPDPAGSDQQPPQ